MSYDSGKGYGSSGSYGQGYGYIPPAPPLPVKFIKPEEIVNPCSGRYEGQEKGVEVEIMVDVDKTRKYAKALKMISGTISAKNTPWTVKANSLHFKVMGFSFRESGKKSNNRDFTSDVKVVFSDGTKAGGSMDLKVSFDSAAGTWRANLVLDITGQSKLSFKNIMRKSLFFKDVKLDVDFTEKLTWPTVELTNLTVKPSGMENRKLDPFSAFEDAGLKLLFDPAHSQQVEDPSPYSPWTKSDLYEVMVEYFNGDESSDDNIWCMMGTTPPDKRHAGFSFDKNGHHGFGLFVGHKSFENLEHENARKKAKAQRNLLHYLVRECGHCLGLKQPLKIGAPGSKSWMNYAGKYDARHNPGSFYGGFKFCFSDVELLILRHAPGKAFKKASSPKVTYNVMGSGYNVKTDVPDQNLADDDDDNDVESGDYGDTLSEKPRPMRKVALDLRVRNQYSKDQLFSFEARLKNQGKLPALIESDLSIEAGNLQVFITKPDGSFHPVEPFVRPIYTGYSKPKVLYTPEDEEGSDRYSQQVSIGAGPDGYLIDEAGQYEIRAVYSAGRYTVTSASHSVMVVDDTDDDKETSEEVLTAATLQSSNSKRYNKTLEFWKKQKSQSIEKRKSKVATLIALFEGMANQDGRYAGGSSKQKRRGPKKVAVVAAKPALSRQQLLKDTDDLVQYYREKGTKEDNFDYTRLVLARGKLYAEEKKIQDGGNEFGQLVLDILDREVKLDTVKKLAKKWKKIANPPKVEERYTPENLQNKVNSVLRWVPTTYDNGEPDLSGIGLGNPFSNFNSDNIQKAKKIIDILFHKYDETQDIYATVSYADKLQKGREVNYMALRWSLEAFIVHSMSAKKAGIKYPEPEEMDKSVQLDVAKVIPKREGISDEQWMDYWRGDADFNYHHRHFHVVYVVGNFFNGSEIVNADPHLGRQGELFGYMHTQVLARYDAERESWGLKPVQPWRYDEKAASFNAGVEFHSDSQYHRFAPRPNTVWPQHRKGSFLDWETAYKKAVDVGHIRGIALDANWAGHILEPSSGMFYDTCGSLHNSGHGIFGFTGVPDNKASYMSDTATAVRDPIFYRWHKKIDDLLQLANDKIATEITEDAPSVTITADDIILNTDPKPPAGFQSWSNGWTQKPPAGVTRVKTFLGPPTKKSEWDNKINHEKFYYHIRIKRNPTSAKKEALPLTVRIFICPKKQQTVRTRWIEMDKFVCKIEANQDYIAVTRADVHSSVIKRSPKDMENSFEKKFAETVEGFCECGWPYHMLLPRGKKDGEDYVLFVMATDNNVDTIGVTTSCGSMSYCGAKNKEYPDKQPMGYPFSTPIYIKDEKMDIPQVFDRISNAAYKTFKIESDVAEPPPVKGIDVWRPIVQLAGNDGTMGDTREMGVPEVSKSNLTGNFRVLIDNLATEKSKAPNIKIRFQGRGLGGGTYDIGGVQIALRDEETNRVKGPQTQITYQGRERFSVPENGLLSDPVPFMIDPALGDYFVDFTLDTPGVKLLADKDAGTSTFYKASSYKYTPWRKYADIQCISGILSTEE